MSGLWSKVEERIGIKVRNKSAKNDGFVSLVKALNRRGGKFLNCDTLKTVTGTSRKGTLIPVEDKTEKWYQKLLYFSILKIYGELRILFCGLFLFFFL